MKNKFNHDIADLNFFLIYCFCFFVFWFTDSCVFESCKYTTTLLTLLTFHFTASYMAGILHQIVHSMQQLHKSNCSVLVKQHSTCFFKQFGETMKFVFERLKQTWWSSCFLQNKHDSHMGADYAFFSAILETVILV